MSIKPQMVWSVNPLPAAQPSTTTPENAADELLTKGGMRVWGVLSMLSLADQGLTSGAGFGVNLLLARWLPAQLYGAFAVAFAFFLFVSGFHNVLLLEPMSVFGPSQYAEALPVYFRAQIAIHALLVGGLSIVVLVVGLTLRRFDPTSPLPGALLGSGLALPFLLLLWLVRRMCYVMQRPSVAVTGSAFYLAFVATGLFVLRQTGRLSPFTTFVLMGLGSALAAGMLIGRLEVLKPGVPVALSVAWRTALRENWHYGRWLAGSTVLWSIASQVQTFLVAGVLGLGAAGILRAMQLPSLVMTQINAAIYLLVLPTLSREFGQRRFQSMRRRTLLVTLGLGSSAGVLVLVLLLFRAPLERLVFGGKYAEHALLIPLLALVPAIAALSVGFSAALRAARKPHVDLLANGIAAPVGVISALEFLPRWGLNGAAASMAVSLATYALVYALCYHLAKARMYNDQVPASLRAGAGY